MGKFTKGRIAEEWIQFIETHYANQGHKLKARDSAPKFISALWEHICNGCGKSETISTMLTITDALRDTNVRNNNNEWRRSGNAILNCKADYNETK
jgi:hypothetical protein